MSENPIPYMDALKHQLMGHEGFSRFPYRCSSGRLTIGYGRNLEDRGITKHEARVLLKNDIAECYRDCCKIFPNFENLSHLRQRVILDMRFNLGPAGFREFKGFIAAVNSNDIKAAAGEMMDSKWYHQVEQRGRMLVKMWISGKEGNLK